MCKVAILTAALSRLAMVGRLTEAAYTQLRSEQITCNTAKFSIAGIFMPVQSRNKISIARSVLCNSRQVLTSQIEFSVQISIDIVFCSLHSHTGHRPMKNSCTTRSKASRTSRMSAVSLISAL
jgi:hypothetical protein